MEWNVSKKFSADIISNVIRRYTRENPAYSSLFMLLSSRIPPPALEIKQNLANPFGEKN